MTCFFCHTIDAVTGSHNAAVTLAGDLVMRGEYSDPVANTAHASTYDALHDRDRIEQRRRCAARATTSSRRRARHRADVRRVAGLALRRPERRRDVRPVPHEPEHDARCRSRRPRTSSRAHYHAHDFPARRRRPDPPSRTPRPSSRPSRPFLQTTLQTALCVTQQGARPRHPRQRRGGALWPSGAAQDRRAWAEVIASKGGQVFYQSGVVPDGTPGRRPCRTIPTCGCSATACSTATDAQVDMFWQAASYRGQRAADAGHDRQDRPALLPDAHLPALPARAQRQRSRRCPTRSRCASACSPSGSTCSTTSSSTGDLDAGVAAAMPTFDVDAARHLDARGRGGFGAHLRRRGRRARHVRLGHELQRRRGQVPGDRERRLQPVSRHDVGVLQQP